METKNLKKKNKKPNFTQTELEVLVEGIAAGIHIINSSFTNTITNNLKKKTWADITAKVNSVSKSMRNEEEVRKKWTDLKAQTKKTEAIRKGKMNMTGGGPPHEELTALERKILQLIPQCLIDGIKGGKETPVAVTVTEDLDPIVASEPALACEAESIPGCSKDSAELEEYYTPLSTPDANCKGQTTAAQSKVRPPRKRSTCDDSTDNIIKGLSETEEKKIKVFEDILVELKLLNSIQAERLSLEKRRFENETTNSYPILQYLNPQ